MIIMIFMIIIMIIMIMIIMIEHTLHVTYTLHMLQLLSYLNTVTWTQCQLLATKIGCGLHPIGDQFVQLRQKMNRLPFHGRVFQPIHKKMPKLIAATKSFGRRKTSKNRQYWVDVNLWLQKVKVTLIKNEGTQEIKIF